MIIDVTDKEFLEKEIVLKLPKKDINLSKEKKINELSKSLNLRGFRKGFIPRSIIVSRFEKDIDFEILNDLLYKNLVDFLKKNNIICVKFPVLKNTDYTSLDDYVIFIFTFEVYPVINIDFDKISVLKYKSVISDFDIDFEIERLRKIHCTWEFVDYISLDDKISFDILDNNNRIIFSDNDILINDKYKKIVGLCDFALGKMQCLTYPIFFNNNVISDEIKSGNQHFLKINTIKRQKLACLNSDFYAKIGFDQKHDIRSFIKLRLTDVMFDIINIFFKRDILSALLLNHDFNVPKSMLDDKFLELKHKALDKDNDFVLKEVKLNLLLKELIKKFNIRVSRDEVLNFSYDKYAAVKVDESFYSYIENELFIDKIKEVLVSKIRVDEKEVTFSELLNMSINL